MDPYGWRDQDSWILGIMGRAGSIDPHGMMDTSGSMNPWNDGEVRIHESSWMEKSESMDPWNDTVDRLRGSMWMERAESMDPWNIGEGRIH